jgi:hypothetical protein
MKTRISAVHHDNRGRLEVIEGLRKDLTNFSRFFIISELDVNSIRGEHAHRTQTQAFFALEGSCTLSIESKEGFGETELRQDGTCYIVPPMTWVVLRQFSDDCKILILSDGDYDQADYIFNLDQFRSSIRGA